jgi:phage FluMu protein Com
VAFSKIEKKRGLCRRCRHAYCNKSLFASTSFNSYAEKASRKRKLINDAAVKKRANGWKKNEL